MCPNNRPAFTRKRCVGGGEALSVAPPACGLLDGTSARAIGARATLDADWYAVWVRSQCEQRVHDQLSAKGFRPLLPKVEMWSRRGARRIRVRVPMFPGYLFLHHAMDPPTYSGVANTQGVARILGDRWGSPIRLPEYEVNAIRRLDEAPMTVLAHSYLRSGQRVRVTHGLLAGVEGFLVRINPAKGLLVVSVHLLQRSVAVEVEWSAVTPM